jgi:glyceraldehyde-3-phosphate dehydrogenase/erythrose-4-phosphate dehydrogenase
LSSILKVIPELKGKIDDTIFRVPVSNVSIVDLNIIDRRHGKKTTGVARDRSHCWNMSISCLKKRSASCSNNG